jgi:hypothetical protein
MFSFFTHLFEIGLFTHYNTAKMLQKLEIRGDSFEISNNIPKNPLKPHFFLKIHVQIPTTKIIGFLKDGAKNILSPADKPPTAFSSIPDLKCGCRWSENNTQSKEEHS